MTFDYSVIVPTRNRCTGVIACLDAVRAAMLNAPGSTGELIVVDNGSTDATHEVIELWREKQSIPVQHILEPTKGLSHARNRGIREAQGTLLIFIDDDCHMDVNHIAQAIAYDAADTAPVMRGGSVHLGDSTDQPHSIKTGTAAQHWSRAEHSARRENLGNTMLGCNMVMRKLLVDTVGPFDVNLGAGSKLPGGEDIDYVFRAYLAGFRIEYVPDMRVYHFHGRKLDSDLIQLCKNYSIGTGALYAKFLFVHPNFCRQLYWDSRNMFKEIFTGKNQFEAKLGFSLRNKLTYCFSGMFQYWRIRLAQ